MKVGKQNIYTLPTNDVRTLAILAQRRQYEAVLQDTTLPRPARLAIGEPHFSTPAHIKLAAIAAIQHEAIGYGPAAGWPWLRDLLAQKIKRVNQYEVDPENTAITMGGTGAIQATLNATIGVGDEVLLPNPGWPQYCLQVACSGATPVYYPLNAARGWLPDIVDLERLVTPHTRMIIINSPANPTGAVFPAQLVSDLLAFTHRHNLYLLSDECYDEIIFDGEHTSPAKLLSHREFESGQVIGVYTFSKTYAMTGWRVGYVVTSKNLIKTISNVLDSCYTNISNIVQRAAAAALSDSQACVTEMRFSYLKHRDLVAKVMKECGNSFDIPHGAFYALISTTGIQGEKWPDREFARDLLLERNVSVAPGCSFGPGAEHYVRISLAVSEKELEYGVREICSFANREVHNDDFVPVR